MDDVIRKKRKKEKSKKYQIDAGLTT